MDLIDRNELYKQIRLYLNRHSLGETAVWTTLTVGEIANIIANMPTVEAEPIRHGKWINELPYTADGKYLKGQECSVCHSYFVSDGNKLYSNHPYCSQCGTKMEGEMIYCKECEWYEPDSGICKESEHDELFGENDGCNQGKRRDD